MATHRNPIRALFIVALCALQVTGCYGLGTDDGAATDDAGMDDTGAAGNPPGTGGAGGTLPTDAALDAVIPPPVEDSGLDATLIPDTSVQLDATVPTDATVATDTAVVWTDADFGECDGLDPLLLGLFRNTYIHGASNTRGCETPCDLASLQSNAVYYARVIVRGYERVRECVDYSPTIAWRDMTEDVSLAMSMDVFYHQTSSLEGFKATVHDEIDGFRAEHPAVPYIVPNVPVIMMADSANARAINDWLEQFVDADDNLHLLDLDAAYDGVLSGKITYDGRVITADDVMLDFVHVNDLGQLLVAELIIARLNEEFPGLDIPPYGDLVIAD